MENLPTCIAPWHALTIKWGGNVVPDIITKTNWATLTITP